MKTPPVHFTGIPKIRFVSPFRPVFLRPHQDDLHPPFQNVLDRYPIRSRAFHLHAGAAHGGRAAGIGADGYPFARERVSRWVLLSYLNHFLIATSAVIDCACSVFGA